MAPIRVIYCSWSAFKKEEWEVAQSTIRLDDPDGEMLGELFNIEFRDVATSEPLLCDLEGMVRSKAKAAYRAVKVPCIVEHAGLILEGYEKNSFPGGLTQPMWDDSEGALCRKLRGSDEQGHRSGRYRLLRRHESLHVCRRNSGHSVAYAQRTARILLGYNILPRRVRRHHLR